MLASAMFTFIASWYYKYGYTEGIILAGVSIAAFSIISTIFTIKSKAEFAETADETEEPTEPEEPELLEEDT